MMNPLTLLLLVGGGGTSPVEQVIRQAHQAAARDLAESLLVANVVERAIVATDDTAWTTALAGLPIQVDPDPPGEPFHFGQRLAGLIERYRVDRVLYAGGGSAPLMTPADWQAALEPCASATPLAVTNNLHSSDWIAFSPAATLLPIVAQQERDNALAWVLAHEAGLPTTHLPPSAASRFDLDTPADVLVARAHPHLQPHLAAALRELDWPAQPVEGVLRIMGQEGGHMAVIGRSSAAAWGALETATRCWVRLVVEERGMIASGRLKRGEVRSLLADWIRQTGVEAFFGELATMVEAALFDTRVILAAYGLWPSAADRFHADLCLWDRVQEPFLRRLAHAASQVEIPLIMGGQSVVNGGLLALLETLDAQRKQP